MIEYLASKLGRKLIQISYKLKKKKISGLIQDIMFKLVRGVETTI